METEHADLVHVRETGQMFYYEVRLGEYWKDGTSLLSRLVFQMLQLYYHVLSLQKQKSNSFTHSIHSTEHNPSLEANRLSASQEIPHIL